MKTHKSIFFTIAVIFTLQSCVVSEKPNIDFFKDSDYREEGARFTSFNVPLFLARPYIRKALKEDGESEEMISLVKKVSKIRIMTVENGNTAMIKDYARHLRRNNFEDWATIKHNGENVNVQVKQQGDGIRNMLITVNSDKELVFVDVKGNFTADDISKMINAATDKDK